MLSARDSGLCLSGELLPCFRLDRGTRAGIREGLRVGLPGMEVGGGGGRLVAAAPVVGVLFMERGGTDLGGAATLLGADLGPLSEGVAPAGVLDRAGGTFFLEPSVASISSKYRSPKTRKGRPYSSSHL